MITSKLSVENAKIIFRNFSGKEGKFNRAGDRNFSVVFDKQQGEELLEEGWNLKILAPRDEYEEVKYAMPVKVQYGKFPPKIYLISGRKRQLLDEDSISCLDYAEIETVDLIIRPYNWEVNGKTGVKAYAHIMYVTIQEDRFASKYDFDDPYSRGPVDEGNMPF